MGTAISAVPIFSEVIFMKCLRCSRSAKASFCEECLKTVSVPLVPSQYLNTQINLNAKRTVRAAAASTNAKKENEPRQNRGLIVSLVLISVLCCALAACCLYLARHHIYSMFF